MKRLAWIWALVLVSTACEFREDLDAGRDVTIKRTAPLPNVTTAQRSRFCLLIDDSEDRPAELKVFAQIDVGTAAPCAFDPDRVSTIDRTEKGATFWCRIDPLTVGGGPHNVRYWVENRDGLNTAQTTVSFGHDPVGPKVTAGIVREDGGVRLTWTVEDEGDFAEVSVHTGGVRLFSSFAKNGSTLLDAALLTSLPSLEVRAYDRLKNEDVAVLSLTE